MNQSAESSRGGQEGGQEDPFSLEQKEHVTLMDAIGYCPVYTCDPCTNSN